MHFNLNIQLKNTGYTLGTIVKLTNKKTIVYSDSFNFGRRDHMCVDTVVRLSPFPLT